MKSLVLPLVLFLLPFMAITVTAEELSQTEAEELINEIRLVLVQEVGWQNYTKWTGYGSCATRYGTSPWCQPGDSSLLPVVFRAVMPEPFGTEGEQCFLPSRVARLDKRGLWGLARDYVEASGARSSNACVLETARRMALWNRLRAPLIGVREGTVDYCTLHTGYGIFLPGPFHVDDCGKKQVGWHWDRLTSPCLEIYGVIHTHDHSHELEGQKYEVWWVNGIPCVVEQGEEKCSIPSTNPWFKRYSSRVVEAHILVMARYSD